MTRRILRPGWIALAVCAGLLLLSNNGAANKRMVVFVSIAPQKYFVQQIGKDLVDVQLMVPPGADPHAYEPKPLQMIAISRAKLYLAIGGAFEDAWLKRISAANPQMKVVYTDGGIAKLPMAAHHDAVQAHNQDRTPPAGSSDTQEIHRHAQSGLDPHIWLSPPLVKIQARTITNALQGLDPAHRSVYEANYGQFAASIDALDRQLKHLFAGKQGMQFMVFHPAWGYFAHAYGLQQLPIEFEGKAPKPAQLREVIEHARAKGIKVIFVQPQFSVKRAELVAREIGGQVVFADPLAEDWLANMRRIAERFEAALK